MRMDTTEDVPRVVTRREALGMVGGLATAAILSGCGGTGVPSGGPDGGMSTADGGMSAPDGGATCTLYPQETEGPYYLNLNLLRRDITEGKSGTPLSLVLTVQGATGCTPLQGVPVDIWHCDAGGVYSGYPGQLGGLDTTGQTFLRGTQVTDNDGRAQFDTIYPGWYPGRTTHIHFKVHPASNRVATSQLYFPEDRTAAIYESAPYSARGQKDTANAVDATAQVGGFPPLLQLTPQGGGYLATLLVTVQR
jgi:protocatechuate 3,4-dioxygenase beta subunit